ncbi:hypothetical protein NDU88_004923 [Pleurodeles waltl]|uniref:Uncharacterized protein n=1 Tax=Pleurodeles waltl TaxID=8319 RepID=A0AAV7QGW1_PLEWA|nr:hypothetical protein NDU88_004923 [Pleurodeles waltl]
MHSKPDIRLQILKNSEVAKGKEEEDGEERGRSASSLKNNARRRRRRTGACQAKQVRASKGEHWKQKGDFVVGDERQCS